MFITARKLRLLGACEKQYLLFEEMFPQGVEITPAVAVSLADRFNWVWGALVMLNREGTRQFFATALDIPPWAGTHAMNVALAELFAALIDQYPSEHLRYINARYPAPVTV